MSGTTIYVAQDGSANGTTIFGTIQAAVDYAADHNTIGTIDVMAGIYHEEVKVDGSTLTQALTIIGETGASLNAPDVLTSNLADGNNPNQAGPGVALLAVVNGANVTVDGLDVNGRDEFGQATSHGINNQYGIYYADSSGTIENASVTGISDHVQPGGIHGFGIFVGNVATSTAHEVDVTNMTITDFQRTGIRVVGSNFTSDVTHNTITGSVSTTADFAGAAETAILFRDGAGGLADNNTISNVGYFNSASPTVGAAGIEIYNNAGVDLVTSVSNNLITLAGTTGHYGANWGIGVDSNVASHISVTGNTVSGADMGILQYGDGANLDNSGAGVFQPPSLDVSTDVFSNDSTNLTVEDSSSPAATGSGAFNMMGTSGADTLLAGDNNNDVVNGGGGSGTGVDTLGGGAGSNDTVTFSGATASVMVDLNIQDGSTVQHTGGAGDVVLSGFENLTGTAYDDTLTGNGGDNVIRGNFGNDFINAGDGNDQLHGGGGNDEIHAQGGNDIAYGGTGDDVIYGGVGSDVLDGGGEITAGDSPADVGNDTLNGATPLATSGTDDTAGYLSAGGGVTVSLTLQGSAQDTVHAGWDTLSNINNLIGSTFDDTLYGDSGNNVLSGGQGNDELHGGQGADTLYGGSGNDTIYGGAGCDQIIGGAGDDTLYGGNGGTTASWGDTFYFSDTFGHDTIVDFNADSDTLAFNYASSHILHVDTISGVVIYDDVTGDSVLVQGLTWNDVSGDIQYCTAAPIDQHLNSAETGYLVDTSV